MIRSAQIAVILFRWLLLGNRDTRFYLYDYVLVKVLRAQLEARLLIFVDRYQ